ncbi:ABC transporter ATP-binding protein [Nocardia sp. CNY236]|uniref:ABC transporter ATP-binding protein n=1 Tax=Nocardia sp. CNY236 TaxID=1169152 RepID=UPI0004117C69|nr:ABC transporter ATP-binding protein [Nocardia sp. CNY236]
MTLEAHLSALRGQFRLDMALRVAPGEVVAVLGPNGAGKTTALRTLAGLTPLAEGWIRLDGNTWDAPPTVFVPAEHRQVGVVFQDHLLFAHLSVLDNVAFGVRARGHSRKEARARAARWLSRVGLGEHADAKPRTLSGGQSQRVALARALVTDPKLLLLDEPLAALDASTRVRVRSELTRHLTDYRGRTVLVTHDPLDAMVLADRLVIIEQGTVIQEGPPADIARRPRTDYVADLVGLNLYRGTARDTTVELTDGGILTVAEVCQGRVHVTIAPSAVGLYPARPADSPHNMWPVVVAGIEQHAHTVRVRLDGVPTAFVDITPAAVADLHLRPGIGLWAGVEAADVHTYPA